MKPLKLTMQAFGSYGKKTPPIDFTKPTQNLFLITGDTGAGKTTIFDAIVFALYGETSSGTNRKDGLELQSQFTGHGLEPFVELEFSEKDGEETKVYTVRRIPRHVRPLKRGSGTKEESGRVSLIMPDGTEYPQKETDRKLEEIVGLNKGQFMQVAMIAQGEFMELLRAKSDDKKVIFRKLFNTGLFQDIVDELGRRRKEKLSDMAHIRTVCQTEVRHVVVPEDYEEGEALRELQQKILSSDKLSITDMETFLRELQALCDRLESGEKEARKAYEKASGSRDVCRDAFTSAQDLLKSFEQLERAERALSECVAEEEECKEAAGLISDINGAYEIKGVYQRFMDAEGLASDTEKKLKGQKDALPGLIAAHSKAAALEEKARKDLNTELEAFTRISERVKKALAILDKIRDGKKDVAAKETELLAAEAASLEAQRDLAGLEAQEQEWRRQIQGLEGAEKLLALWEIKNKETDGIAEDVSAAKKLRRSVDSQRKKADKAQQDYIKARQEFVDKNAEFTQKQRAFLDAQAGFLAKEKLRPGEPCPVCGSVEHPHPCALFGEHQDLTREQIDALAKEAADLLGRQQDASGMAAAALELLAEKENHLKETMDKLWERMSKTIQETPEGRALGKGPMPEGFTVERAEKLLAFWRQQVEAEGVETKKNADTLAQVQSSLRGIDEKKQLLNETVERARQKAVDRKVALAGARAALSGLEGDKDYPTKEGADAALKAATDSKNEKDKAYIAANQALKAARQRKDNAQALQERYARELPAQKEERDRRRDAYKEILGEKALTQDEWRAMVQKYPKSQTASLQEKIDGHNRKKATAEGIRESAQKAIAGRERPVIEELQKAKDQAEEELEAAQKALERYRDDLRADLDAYNALSPRMEERSRIAQEYTRIDSLYNRLAGKVTGSRMDIETFAQRYYLQRILYAANARFREMSAGQFELRMVGEEQAGEGKNRGLDLMVYSNVTGKEREVRTLSGGESFMAALSLALGMADQIGESSAAINLDVMFIDEGFGSLDEHSRDQAVKVLRQMAGGSKLIGIISHVTELKQEIEDQLLVTKDGDGSHVKWQIS